LLAHFVVVDSMPHARALLPTLPPGVHVVTRNGDILRSNAVVVAGHANGSSNLLSVEREWRELPALIETAAAKVAAIESQRAELAAQANDVMQIQAQLADALRELDVSAAQSVAARDAAARRVETIERETAWKNERAAQTAAEADAIAQKVEALSHEIAAQDQRAQLLEQIAAGLDQRLAALPLDDLAAQVTALQTEALVSEQLRQGRENVLRSQRAALEQTHTQIATRNRRIAEIAQEYAQVAAQIIELREREQTFAAQLDDYRARIEPIEHEVRRMEDAYTRVEQEERAARTRSQELEGRLNLAVMEVRRREDELNHMRERIDEELGLVQLELADLTAPQPLPLAPIVTELPVVAELPEGLEQQRQLLKAQIRRLGPINPEAQAEYDTLSERFEFLETQSGDLADAIAQLQQVIAELDQLMESSFRETFDRIAEEFKGTFHALFGGGTARLVLTEPDRLMESGIEILARPPGKKQQSLALLSGGERSLTAAALLFAILKVTPPPFCILDETDAALDEANIGRFREMIRAQSHATQFVLITHNRGTIEAADTIYGVTMERDSSSRAYSLKLEGDAIAA
jgi:chromosome segregation protein